MTMKQSAVKEVKEEVEPQPQPNNLINRIYLITKTGFEIWEGTEAEADIKAIQKASEEAEDGDTPFVFYEDGRPVYIAVKNGYLSSLAFPEPGSREGQTGMTSMELYGISVTLPSTIEKIIELETQPKPSLIDQAKKIMTPTIAIVACVFVIFLMLALMKG